LRALNYIYAIVLASAVVDVAIISVLENSNVAFEWPSTLLAPYHYAFFLFFIPLASGLIASVHDRALFWKGLATGFLLLVSGLEDLAFVLLKYGPSGDWLNWNWNWLMIAPLFKGSVTTHQLFAVCFLTNLFVLWWWGRVEVPKVAR